MTDVPADAGWRLVTQADIPFVYELITLVDPRWWRFSKHGLEPSLMLATTAAVAAGVVVHDGTGRPVACGVLVDAGASGTGTFEYFARPDSGSEALARRFAPELVDAAFRGAAVQRLYRERFAGDADLYGDVNSWFETEVVFPSYALIEGRYEARTVDVLTRERFLAHREQATA